MKDVTLVGIAVLVLVSVGATASGEDASAQPSWPGEYEKLKVLNNFVTGLLSVSSMPEDGSDYAFSNPRDGWVFISMAGSDSESVAVLDDATTPLVWRRNPATGVCEAMQLLSEGAHRVRVLKGEGMRLDIRTMPEIAFCYYPSHRHIAAYPAYDWAYMEHHVLPDVNALITRSAVSREEFEQWLREGRHWIANAHLPGLGASEAPSPDAVYEAWAGNDGVTQPGFAGIMVDEFFGSGAEHYASWGEAVRRLHANPGFANRTFYAWCGDLFGHEPSLAFSRLLMDLGYRFSWERYMREAPTRDKAREAIQRDAVRRMVKWKAALPGVERHMVMCLGYLSAPPETLNLDPGVDYHVFMDMQFQVLATDPAFWGLYGIIEYMAAYADEESIRYAQKLFRHYCIEGKRTRFNDDPYALPHLANPDFADGLTGWRAQPAHEGAIDTKEMDGFSWLQGRYPKTPSGDRFCWMKRSGERPNRVSQTIKALEPGRLYSVKLISAGLQQLGQEQQLALSIHVGGGETLDDHCFQFVYPSCYSHIVEPYNRERPAYMNFHRVVFRAKGHTAELGISDWATGEERGGPAGQEIAFNFVEVQPFHAP